MSTSGALRALLNIANIFTKAPQTINIDKPGVPGLVITAAAAQASTLQEWRNNGGGLLAYMAANGGFVTSGLMVANTGAQLGVIQTPTAAPTIASAATIAPTAPITFISGVTAINTITPPTGVSALGGQITLIPTGLWTLGVTGNIAIASNAVVGKAMTLVYDSVTLKWYPSY